MDKQFTNTDIELLRMAVNEAMDCCKNPARYKLYQGLLKLLQ